MFRYTSEHKDFIQKFAPGRYNDEITNLFNARFGTNLTENQIKNFKSNHKIKSHVPSGRATGREILFTKKQKDFIVKHVEGRSNVELTDLFNSHFGLSIKVSQIKSFKKNNRLSSGLTGRFEPGRVPFNKGIKKYWIGGEDTQFKKGHIPKNYMPVGTERVNTDDYVDIKIADPNKWRGKHLVIWEKHNERAVPTGYVVIFGDGNRRNFNPDNLILVTRGQLAIMNRRGLIQKDAELTRTGILLADIYKKIGEKKRERKNEK
ncbi:HNH endonuclease signature motif containing protein [Paenibacillus yanchengensis]|uniref:HNH endonuclease signature motif containing protein n=1 Tax=Paenibacillus yanchengensis TaxID=2035833 RepID=A0ABW4YL19_9BACL